MLLLLDQILSWIQFHYPIYHGPVYCDTRGLIMSNWGIMSVHREVGHQSKGSKSMYRLLPTEINQRWTC